MDWKEGETLTLQKPRLAPACVPSGILGQHHDRENFLPPSFLLHTHTKTSPHNMAGMEDSPFPGNMTDTWTFIAWHCTACGGLHTFSCACLHAIWFCVIPVPSGVEARQGDFFQIHTHFLPFTPFYPTFLLLYFSSGNRTGCFGLHGLAAWVCGAFGRQIDRTNSFFGGWRTKTFYHGWSDQMHGWLLLQTPPSTHSLALPLSLPYHLHMAHSIITSQT